MFHYSIFDILETAEIGAYAVTVDQTVQFWNREAQRILGFSAEEIVGQRCYEILAGLATGSMRPECEGGCSSIRCLQAGQIPETLRLRMLCKSGVRKSVSLTPMVIGGGRNDAPLLVHLFTDGRESDGLDQASETIRHELARGGYDVVSDRTGDRESLPEAPRLTPRETQALRLMALGCQVSEIAEQMGISPHTVRNHIRNFRRKLKAATRLEAVVNAIRLGILELD